MNNIEDLSVNDLNVIKKSLKYTKLRFEDYQGYPSYEFKLGQVKEVNDVLIKVDNIIKSKK